MTVDCPHVSCDNNNFFEKKCTITITRRLVDYAKQPNSNMCEHLKREVLQMYESDEKLLDYLLPRI